MIDSYFELEEVVKIVLKHKSTWYRRINPDKIQITLHSPLAKRWSKKDIDAVMASISSELENRGTE